MIRLVRRFNHALNDLKQINRIVSLFCRFFFRSFSLYIFLLQCVYVCVHFNFEHWLKLMWTFWCFPCRSKALQLNYKFLLCTKRSLPFFFFFAAMNKSQFKEKFHSKGALKFIQRWRVVVTAFLLDRSVGRALVSGRKKACLCLILFITNTSKYTKYWTISFEINPVIDAVDCHFPFCAAPCSI